MPIIGLLSGDQKRMEDVSIPTAADLQPSRYHELLAWAKTSRSCTGIKASVFGVLMICQPDTDVARLRRLA